MKLTTKWEINLKEREVINKVNNANKAAMRGTVVAIASDAIKGSPKLTGNNMRSIKYEVGPGGDIAQKEGEGAVYSTSGYGGILETGSIKMAARPYFKPALDRNLSKLPANIKAYLA